MSKFSAFCNGFTGRNGNPHPRENYGEHEGYEWHMATVHGRKTTRTRKPGMWKMPTRKAFEPEGITLGATVIGAGRALPWHSTTQGIQGQVWSKAPGQRMWWVVTDQGHAYAMHELSMTVLGQCVSDVALFAEESA